MAWQMFQALRHHGRTWGQKRGSRVRQRCQIVPSLTHYSLDEKNLLQCFYSPINNKMTKRDTLFTTSPENQIPEIGHRRYAINHECFVAKFNFWNPFIMLHIFFL